MEPAVYILIRTKHQFYLTNIFQKRYHYFREALESTLRQSHPNLNIIILQDSWWRLRSKPKMVRLPKFCADIYKNYQKEAETKNKRRIYFYSTNSRGAAHALYNIRQVLFKFSKNDEDIAIMLDDDDIFSSSNVVEEIAKILNNESAAIGISQFRIIGDTKKNIVNKGGNPHNELVKNKRALTSDNSELAFADSLGWTKSYRVGVLKQYHNDLYKVFGSIKRLERFLFRNNAYEDFPEIINLCRKDVKVMATGVCSHAYRKHSSSITAKPRRKDFSRKRPNYLALLVKLYDNLNKEGRLTDKSNIVIARYCTIKMLVIENILARYRDSDKIFWRLINLKREYFLRRMVITLRKWGVLNTYTKMLKDTEESSRSINNALFKASDVVQKIIDEEVNKLDDRNKKTDWPFAQICKACLRECFNGRVDITNLIADKSITLRAKLNKKRVWSKAIYIFLGLFFVGGVWILLDKNKVATIVSIVSTILGFLFTLNQKQAERDIKRKQYTNMYIESVKELNRHITAGLNILLQLKKELDDNQKKLNNQKELDNQQYYRPAKVHFTNLKVEQASMLLSSEFDKYIIVEEFSNLPNLRVNIRNINNSAEFMEEYVYSDKYDPHYMQKIIEWEIVRYVSYITRLSFFADKRTFALPSSTALLLYVMYDDVIKDLSKKLKGADVTEKMLTNYFIDFLKDRTEERKVLSIPDQTIKFHP